MNQLFDCRYVGERWECRPAAAWAHFGFVFSLFGTGLLLYLSVNFLWNIGDAFVGSAFGLMFLGVAVMLSFQALRYWRLRDRPLAVDGAGRVSYGQEELCPAGSVRSVNIVPDPHAESGDCKVIFDLAEARTVELPGVFFGAISRREVARFLAEELARALKVEVVEKV